MFKIAYQVYTFHRGHSVVSAVQPRRSKCTENMHCTTGEVSHTPSYTESGHYNVWGSVTAGYGLGWEKARSEKLPVGEEQNL